MRLISWEWENTHLHTYTQKQVNANYSASERMQNFYTMCTKTEKKKTHLRLKTLKLKWNEK